MDQESERQKEDKKNSASLEKERVKGLILPKEEGKSFTVMDPIEEILRRNNPRISDQRVKVLLTEYRSRKIPRAIAESHLSDDGPISFSQMRREQAAIAESRLSALRPKRKTSYADILDQRKRRRREDLQNRRREREINVRIKRYTSVSQSVVLKDTEYPTSITSKTTFDRHEDAYSGPWDEAEWGRNGKLYEWHKSTGYKEAISMKELTLFPD